MRLGAMAIMGWIVLVNVNFDWLRASMGVMRQSFMVAFIIGLNVGEAAVTMVVDNWVFIVIICLGIK